MKTLYLESDEMELEVILLVPKLQLGNAELEAPASSVKSSWSLQGQVTQARAWELAQNSCYRLAVG